MTRRVVMSLVFGWLCACGNAAPGSGDALVEPSSDGAALSDAQAVHGDARGPVDAVVFSDGAAPSFDAQPTDECRPTTCEANLMTCGELDDRCGNVLDCGRCEAPRSCVSSFTSMYCSCTAPPEIVTLATGQWEATQLVADDTHLYWVNTFAHEVKRMSKAGEGEQVLAADQLYPQGLALDDTHVYWTSYDGDAVRRIAKAGGTVETIATEQDGADGIIVDDDYVYWVNNVADEVVRRDKSMIQPVEVLARYQRGATGIAHDEGHIYWTNYRGNSIERMNKSTGEHNTVSSGQTQARSIAVGDTYVYATRGDGRVVIARKEGGFLADVLATNEDRPMSITLGETQVYWTTNGDGRVKHKPLHGYGVVRRVALDQYGASGVVVDQSDIYWTTRYQVMRVSSACYE